MNGWSPSASFAGWKANTVGVDGGKSDEEGEFVEPGEDVRDVELGWVSILSA